MLILFYSVSPQYKGDCITAQTRSTEEAPIAQTLLGLSFRFCKCYRSTMQRGVPESSSKQ
ncbi:hypothetical protein P692DRAFT_201795508 [Suillus brevipes Sb2]|nr:hypothetical protein P692DRAFT_201795508 [Suillus brevipes Sb2]